MATPVLATKLFAPTLRTDLVSRPRLIDRISVGLQRKLTLVSAPAGYGKTTLISCWLRETPIPSVWFSLDEEDNDPVRFFQYFVLALRKIIPDVGENWMGMPQGVQSVPLDASLNLLVNEIADYAGPFVMVLDDFHVVRSQSVLDIVTLLLERMPPQMHVVLVSRTDPPIPLARLRARNQLLEMRAEQLRFTPDEITIFLNQNMGLNLSAPDLVAIGVRTEGWIASLQLAALSMQERKDPHTFITAFTGSHHYIMDYLVEEVLNVQSDSIRSFLLQTSILDRMCAALCNAVVDINDRDGVDGQELLESLERLNLFLIPLDDERQWYRYHHLFAEVLNRKLEHLFPDKLPGLHLRASEWYEQNGLIPQAIRHSLAAGNLEHTLQLIEGNGCLLLVRGEMSTLQSWIEAVEAQSGARPWIPIFKAWICQLTGNPGMMEGFLQTAERLICAQELSTATDDRIMLGAIALARAYQANLQGQTILASQYSRQAIEYLSGKDLVSRSLRTVAISLLGDASAMNGNLDEAWQAYSEAMQIAQTPPDSNLIIVLNSNLANILMEKGSLHEAHRIYSETLQMATRPDGQKTVIAGRSFAELSQVSYEWNRLQIAVQQIDQSLALCTQWGNRDLQTVCYTMLAQVEHVQHQPAKAREAMDLAGRLSNEHHLLPRYSIWVKSILTRLWIAQEELGKAADLIQQCGIKIDDEEIPYLHEPEYLGLTRLLLAEGNYEAALTLSQRILQKAEATNRMRRVIEVLALQALLFQAKGKTDQALKTLDRALSLAKPEGYIRSFLDEGDQMTRLLHLAKSQGLEKEYVAELLSAAYEIAGAIHSTTQAMSAHLSRREVEVLKLIESGCSNKEIAAKLYISIATVKRHISNIYGKLGAQSRTQAIATGKELGLFDKTFL